jgi:hypothetical protein
MCLANIIGNVCWLLYAKANVNGKIVGDILNFKLSQFLVTMDKDLHFVVSFLKCP